MDCIKLTTKTMYQSPIDEYQPTYHERRPQGEDTPKRRHVSQGSAPTQRVNLTLANVAQADLQAAKAGLSRSAYIDMLIERDTRPEVCTSCGCPSPKKTYDGYWCKMCHNEM